MKLTYESQGGRGFSRLAPQNSSGIHVCLKHGGCKCHRVLGNISQFLSNLGNLIFSQDLCFSHLVFAEAATLQFVAENLKAPPEGLWLGGQKLLCIGGKAGKGEDGVAGWPFGCGLYPNNGHFHGGNNDE